MGRSQETFGKKDREKKRRKKRDDKKKKKEERKENSGKGNGLDSMIAPIYFDENGRVVDTAPDPTVKKEEIDASMIEIGIPKKVKEEEVRRTGKVAFFNHEKGYGFINEINSMNKYFVHINNVKGDIDENDKVSFDVEKGPKGLMAVNVDKA